VGKSLEREKVFSAVLREVAVGRRVWESHRLLDQLEFDEEHSPLVDDFLRKRSSRSLEHVFTILSLGTLRTEISKARLWSIWRASFRRGSEKACGPSWKMIAR
jgi:hypothetical protein